MSVAKLPIPTVYCAPFFRTNVAGEKPVAAICPVELRNSVYFPGRLSPVVSCVDTVNLYVVGPTVNRAECVGVQAVPCTLLEQSDAVGTWHVVVKHSV